MIISNCHCGKRIDCQCELSFDSYLQNSTSVLSVGNLVGGTCTFDAYVIDWFVNGQRMLVSGVGNDPDIQAFHPFINDAAIPVVGGTWEPRVRYVVINGERIYAGIRKCDHWCADLTGLPVINVSSLGCGLRNLPANNLYDYRLSYNTSQDFALASRTVRFDLPDDLSAVYFAFQFTGYEVSDQVDIFFRDSDDPLVSWIVGTRFTTNWWQSMPYRRASNSHKVAFALPSYQAGDYLIIRITPSVMEVNTNTNWQLDVKCLDSSYVFACDYMTLAMKTITSMELVHDQVNCRYDLRLHFQQPVGVISHRDHPFYWMVQYGGYGGLGHSSGQMDHTLGIGTARLSYSKTAQSRSYFISGYNTWIDSFGAFTLSKVGNIVTMVFEDSRDFQVHYDNYQHMKTTDLFTQYNPDPTSIFHYRYLNLNLRIAPAGCGDAFVSKSITMHVTAPVEFIGGNTIKITLVEIENQYAQEPCNSAYTSISTVVNSIRYGITQADFSGTTRCRMQAPLGYGVGYTGINMSSLSTTAGNSIHAYSNLTVPCTEMQLFCNWVTANSFWLFTLFNVRLTITAERDENNNFLQDPTENFEVYSMLSEAGCYTNSNQRMLYKKVNGTETVNILPAF